MHKPVRPKSAKGKTRTVRTTTQGVAANQQQYHAPVTRTSASSSSTSIGPQSNRGTITGAYSSSSLQSKQSPTSSTSRINQSEKVLTPSSPSLFPEINRPTSSLSKYRILPSISNPDSSGDALQHFSATNENYYGHFNEVDLLTEQAQQMLLDSTAQYSKKPQSPPSIANKRKVVKGPVTTENKRQRLYKTQSVFAPSRKPLVKEPPQPRVPREPGPKEKRLLLALKLPDGTRVERHFYPNTKLVNILAYAHSQYPILPVSQCNLFRMDVVPKQLLRNTDMTLEQVGILHRTVLYVEEKEDDDD